MVSSRKRYVTLSPLATGSFGKVYLTWDKVRKRIVVQKDIQVIMDPYVPNVLRESETMRRLCHHPGIVQLLDHESRENGKDTLYMEWLSEGDLLTYFNEKSGDRLRESQARNVMHQLLRAIIWAHALNIVHRDLKLQNIFINSEGYVKIGDWGFATEWKRGRLQTFVSGSEHYASPEILNHSYYEGPESDVWSLGVILYVLVSGHFPFSMDLSYQWDPKRVLTGSWHKVGWFSNDLSDLLTRIFEVDPLKRISLRGVENHPWTRRSKVTNLFRKKKSRIRFLANERRNSL